MTEDQAKEFIEKQEKNSTTLGNVQGESFDSVTMGWKRISLDTLPSRGMFYPEGTIIEIKAASASEIRNFSTIDEDDPFDVNEKLNMVVDKLCKISFSGKLGSFRDIKEIDRFYLIFCVREYTFKNGENKLYLDVVDPQTNETEKVELTKDKFNYTDIDERIMKYYSPSEKCFVFKTKSIGDVYIDIPSIGVSNFIFNYFRERNSKKESYDKVFIRVAPFLIRDWKTLNNQSYRKLEKESNTWDPNKIGIVMELIDKIDLSIKELTHITQSGGEVVVPITFPGKLRSLFTISDIFGELL